MTPVRTLLAAALTLAATPALASQITLHVGPPSVGTGGSNPVSIPPFNPLEYEFIYLSDSDWETNIAISPGILIGKRSATAGGVYVSFGGGLVISANGSGPGVYSSLGWNYGKGWMFNAEVKQALGFDAGRSAALSPYAIRVGVAVEL